MPKLSTCKDCSKKITKEEKYMLSGKAYCLSCYTKRKEKKPVINDRTKLIGVICEYLNIKVPTGLILKQLKEYVDQFDYTYPGIEYTLWYCKDVLNREFDSKYGIGIVKYQYENAEKYFLDSVKLEESIDKIDFNEIINNVSVRSLKNREVSDRKLTIDLDKIIS